MTMFKQGKFSRRYVVVTGTRNDSRRGRDLVFKVLNGHLEECGRGLHLILGDCTSGVDNDALRFALQHGVTYTRHLKDPSEDPKRAPLIRNGAMAEDAESRLRDGNEVVGEAFPDADSRGTWDCRNKLVRAGVGVRVTGIPS